MLDKLDKFHNSKPGFAFFALFGLVIAYVFMSYSIDTGNWFDYLITLLAIIVFLQNLTKLIGSLLHGKRRR
jgi:hypothetical protein